MRGLVLIALLSLQEIPYKPDAEFTLRFDLSFKQRPQAPASEVNLDETRKEYERRTNTTPLPYLKLHLKVLKANENEMRVKVLKDASSVVMNRKVDLNREFQLDLGFTDDIKDRITAYEYTVLFLSDKKQEQSRIVIHFTKDGDYLVNGVRRGKI